MTTLTTMNIKVDKKLKKMVQKTADELGIPLSTLVNMFLKQFAATGRIDFSAVEEMTPTMTKIIAGAEEEIKRGELSPVFSDYETAIEYLHNLEHKK